MNAYRYRVAMVVMPALLSLPDATHAQVVIDGSSHQTTIEAYANAVAGDDVDAAPTGSDGDHTSIDAGLRILAMRRVDSVPDLGLRLVVESTEEDRLDLSESSLLLIGTAGRLEVGERQGLPDVLTGYAPNNFTFASAEFGPASGPSLDPAGGLQPRFIDAPVATQIRELSVLGFAASLADDRSGKVLYVPRKSRGFLGGLSYSPDADDERYGELTQAGLTHETYWNQNVLRVGGSFSWARGRPMESGAHIEDLTSLNAGVTVVLDDALMLGLSATWNGDSGLARIPGASRSSASGWVASANYNSGPWTLGAFYQQARAEGDVATTGNDRLAVLEIGLSWRFDTRTRLFAAWYAYHFDDEAIRAWSGDVVLAGLRVTL